MLKFRNEKRIGRTSFTTEEDEYIKRNYLVVAVKRMAENLGRSDVGVRGRLKAMSLVVPREIVEQRKIDSRIKKGNIPPNKGKKMSPEVYEKIKATMFKKGRVPKNTKFDGHERVDRDGYTLVRVKLGKYDYKHRVFWEAEHGEIPKGKILVFKNGNKADIRLENLECISHAENMKRNTLHRYPEEIRHIIQLRGALRRQINKREKSQEECTTK